MSSAQSPRLRHQPRDLPTAACGLPIGTTILTLEGALPVEYLCAGDRIVTRAGMRILRQLSNPAPQAFALEFDEPQVIYANGRQIHSDTGAEYLH